jgi:hypothetical protein
VSLRGAGLVFALALVPKLALADPCEKVIVDAAVDCNQLDTDRKTLNAMSADEQAKATALTAEIGALERKPLAPYCKALVKLNPKSCNTLASTISVKVDLGKKQPLADAAFKDAVHDKVPADRQTSTNKSGSSAQTDPVESIQPITLAGGALTLAGTRSGTKGIGTISVNPLALASPDSAVLGRIFDLSVSAPFDLDNGVNQDTRYFSARLRVNATAPISAGPLQTAVDKWLHAAGAYADSLQTILEKAPDPKACAESVAATQKVTKEACGEDLGDEAVAKERQIALDEIEKARRAADRYYLGLDARIDTGDPSGTIVVGDKGTHILGGIAAGVRIEQGVLWDWELRGRAAGDYFKSRDTAAGPTPKAIYSFDWGAAIILSGRLKEDAKQRLAFGVGVEGRQASDKDEAKAQLAPTNYANLNLMAIVPAMTGGDLGLAVSIPLAESEVPHGAIVSLSTDLGLLDHTSSN